jgi:hypothetical protein
MDTKEIRTGAAMSASRWATGAVDNAEAALATFQEKLPVRLIATPRSAFETCRLDEKLSVVVARNQGGFDYFPVVEHADGIQERIVGLVELVQFMHGTEPRGFVRDQMRPLSEENLIGADASLLTFIRNADRQKCRLVVSGPEISGLVSLSDLQRLPVRAALFAMVTHLEITMAHAIRSEFNRSEDWINRLSAERKSKVREKAAAAKSEDTFVDTLLFTEFCDKVTIVRKSQAFQWSKTSFESDLAQVQSLRNDLAHANDYAATREAASHVCETVRLIDQWLNRLATWSTRPAESVKDGGSKRSDHGDQQS